MEDKEFFDKIHQGMKPSEALGLKLDRVENGVYVFIPVEEK
jgi:hypothetical protein